MYTNPFLSFIIIILIGIAAAFLFDRFVGTSWFTRMVSGPRRLVTSSLVGIAGSFIGYHLFGLLGVSVSGNLGLFVGAAIGAGAVLWLWRQMK